jgi:glycosyltransferase involved in cell wall biosynthesis
LNPPRLLILSPTAGRGGAEDYILTLGDAAAEAGWHVTVSLESGKGTAGFVEELRSRPHLAYMDARVADDGTRSRLTPLRQAYAASRVIARARPDAAMVALPWPTHGLGLILAPARARVPTAVIFQLAPWAMPLGRRAPLYRWARGRGQRWLAVSDQNRDAIAATFGFPADDIRTIYNGVPTPDEPDPREVTSARQAVRDELGLDSEARIVLSTGRLHDQKGYTDLLEVLPRALEGRPETFLAWAGDGEMRGKLESEIRGRGLQDRVRMLGRREDVPRLLQASDLFLLPSRYEGHPFALLEAMAMHVPTVSSDAGGSPEIMRDGVDGLIHKRGDTDDLARQLVWALDHPTEMRAFADSARSRVAEFSDTRMLDETLALLRELADKRR